MAERARRDFTVDLIGWDLLVCLGGETVTLMLWGLSD